MADVRGAAVGYWRLEGDRTLVRGPDGARVVYAGQAGDLPRTPTSRWLRFETTTAHGSLTLPVEQRIRGLDESFRALWYRIDLTAADTGALPGEAAVRALVDALGSWQAPPFATGLPSGVGVDGAWPAGRFTAELHRLYRPSYSKSVPEEGVVPEVPAPAEWAYHPVDTRLIVPDLGQAARGGIAEQRAWVAAAARRGPALVSGNRTLVLHGWAEQLAVRVVYVDDEVVSDAYAARLGQRGALEVWWDRGRLGTRLLASGLPPGKGSPRRVDDVVQQLVLRVTDWMERGRLGGRAAPDIAPVPPSYQSRVLAALEDAMTSLVEASARDAGFPRRVKSPSVVHRAGHLPMTRVVCRGLPEGPWDHVAEQLLAALDPGAPPEPMFGPGPGAGFDPVAGSLVGPDGSSLTLEKRYDDGLLTPRRLRLRCRSAGLEWPVMVTRRDQRAEHAFGARPQSQNRWLVDHHAALEAWRGEGHRGLPDADRWDAMRQFLEDALLSWGDGRAAGPVVQSVETYGGWYGGQWRDRRLRRLMSRPQALHTPAATQAWTPYPASASWERDARTGEKARADGARLFPAGFLVRRDRDGSEYRHEFMDFLSGEVRIRMESTDGLLRLDSCWPVPVDAPPVAPGDTLGGPLTGGTGAVPALETWRELRDAAEGALEPGQVSDIRGVWIIGAVHPLARRITAYDQERDFPYGLAW